MVLYHDAGSWSYLKKWEGTQEEEVDGQQDEDQAWPLYP